MELTTDPDQALSNSRIVGIKLALLSLRLRDNWARLFGDAEAAAIGLAIVATVAERLMRVDIDHELKSLSSPMPTEALTRCNINAVAEATGLNRETARRKIDRLIAEGMVVRDQRAISLTPGFTQQELATSVVLEQLDELRRAANTLLRIGVLTIQGSPAVSPGEDDRPAV